MSIRKKLLFVVAFIMVSAVISVGTYVALRLPIDRVDREQRILADLRIAILNETAQLNELSSKPFNNQLDVYQSSSRATTAEFVRSESITLLPRIIPTVRTSLDTIRKLKSVHDKSVSDFLFSVMNVQGDAQTVGTARQNFTLFSLMEKSLTGGTEIAGAARGDVGALLNGIAGLSDVMERSTSTIATENSAIAAKVRALSIRANVFSIGLAILMMLIGLVLSTVLTNSIARSVKNVEAGIALLGSGDLTATFTVRTRDEIGSLSGNLSTVVASLRGSLNEVKMVSRENIRIKENLIAVTTQTSVAAHQMGESTRAIGAQILTLDENVARTTNSVSNISENIQSLNQQIQEQSSMVEESTAAVNEMISSINNIASVAEKRKAATEELVTAIEAGSQKMATTFELVTQINESVESIKEITDLIGGIAAQTNLLAMNAAIEAAHAGDAGRGFAVVAQEIRKLAEAASQSSQQIAGNLKRIVERIGSADSSGNAMKDAFLLIDSDARSLAAALAEIFSSMNELRVGGGQILEAMTVLRGVSSTVDDGSMNITQSSAEIRGAMMIMQQVTGNVRSGISDIQSGMSEIGASTSNVRDVATRLGELGETLNTSLIGFKTD
ncbi:MAG TPA: HAMP domain-containing methyl-accepting chemotaxis protein [Spirochaetia bacterium]|nr:HAMP domain-containing methyl-accepting chemotaxis protein [Spirochaetia bacterium]